VLDYYLDRTDFQLTHIADCGGAQVPFHPSMTANGHVHWKMFLKVIEMIAPDKIFNHCLDWCSGPGFIGYSILSKGYCKQLDLADVWLPALNASQMVQGCPPARAWHIQRLNDIPSDVKYDLIVGNPPWSSGHIIDQNRKNCDPKFRIHQHFFEDVKKYLSPQGTIILLEELTYSGPSDFLPFLEHSGLKITKIIANYQHNYWFPIIQHG
jgi:methylase of polypeptide subunit release factors